MQKATPYVYRYYMTLEYKDQGRFETYLLCELVKFQ